MISVITPSIREHGLDLVEKSLRRQTFRSFEWITDTQSTKNEGDFWGIYKAYNRMIKRCKGDLVVTWQDFTYADPTALEKFWFHYTQEPKTIVGAVGNKYSDDTWSVKIWQDPRERDDNGSYYQCYHNDIELNLAAFPIKAFYEVGGFDEYLDKYSSLCGLDVLDRLNIIGGWDFKLDQSIKSYSLDHGRLPLWEENLPFNGPYSERLKLYLQTPKLDYLS